jgi:vacuolar protein sorting-associated protein 16
MDAVCGGGAGRQRKQPTADEYMRSIKRSLTDAVDACLEAAGHELAPATQRSLLKVLTATGGGGVGALGLTFRCVCGGVQAASFGKCFAESYPADKFVDLCRTIRVLNAVRHHETGIALTETQYGRLPWRG